MKKTIIVLILVWLLLFCGCRAKTVDLMSESTVVEVQSESAPKERRPQMPVSEFAIEYPGKQASKEIPDASDDQEK